MRKSRGRLSIGVMACLAVLSVAVPAASGQTSSDPGVTPKSVKIGYVWSDTGVAASSFSGMGDAFKARIAAENAKGGVNGRKIKVVAIDDKSSAANLTAVRDLVENEKVFAVVNDSSFGFLTYRYEIEAGVPVVGGGIDGNYYREPEAAKTIISVLGNRLATPGITSTIFTDAIKKAGGKKVASLGYGISPSSAETAKMQSEYAAPASGLDAVYTNTSVDFGTTDVSPLVLGIKNAGADSVILPMAASTNLAIDQGLKQAGVKMKATMLGAGYGQEVLDSPAVSTLGPTDYFFLQSKPAELKDPAVKRFRSDLKKYSGFTGVPGLGQYYGYEAADLLVTGLEQAGKKLTRQGFLDGLRKLGTWDGAGLTCLPVDISLENLSKSPKNCAYYATVKDGKFVPAFGGKPIIGKTVGSPEAIAANREPGPVTTSVPPTSSP
jgi:ABC-type branched-subunit amino acid transport system substrate-binding protein